MNLGHSCALAIRLAFLGFLAGAALGGLVGGTVGGAVGYGVGAWAGSRYYYPHYAPFPTYGYAPPSYYAPQFYPFYYPRPYAWNPWYGY